METKSQEEKKIRIWNEIIPKPLQMSLSEIKHEITKWIDSNFDSEKHKFFSGFFSLRDSENGVLKSNFEMNRVIIKFR